MTPQKMEYMILAKYCFHPYKIRMMKGLDNYVLSHWSK